MPKRLRQLAENLYLLKAPFLKPSSTLCCALPNRHARHRSGNSRRYKSELFFSLIYQAPKSTITTICADHHENSGLNYIDGIHVTDVNSVAKRVLIGLMCYLESYPNRDLRTRECHGSSAPVIQVLSEERYGYSPHARCCCKHPSPSGVLPCRRFARFRIYFSFIPCVCGYRRRTKFFRIAFGGRSSGS